ncbi:hypothetical protein, partial [uncultured Duncaniella sp.]|uniref:hypothetical protein n=1 Tax=uncultured Duncaniella sp. TaxID=2768039 RepID=UPI0025B7293F
MLEITGVVFTVELESDAVTPDFFTMPQPLTKAVTASADANSETNFMITECFLLMSIDACCPVFGLLVSTLD